MTDLTELNNTVDQLTTVLQSTDLKLDEIRDFVAQLVAGQVTETQIAELQTKLTAAQALAEGVLAETDALDEPAAT